MKSLVALAAAAALAAVAAPAFSQTLPVVGPVTYNGSIGYTGLATSGLGLGVATFRAGADFAKYFGVEAEAGVGMVDHDTAVNGVTGEVHVNDQYALYGVVHYPVMDSTSLFVRGGYGHTDVKTSLVAANAITAGEDSWNYGAGVEHFFDGKNGVRLEYTRVDFQDRGLRDGDSLAVSYVHKF